MSTGYLVLFLHLFLECLVLLSSLEDPHHQMSQNLVHPKISTKCSKQWNNNTSPFF